MVVGTYYRVLDHCTNSWVFEGDRVCFVKPNEDCGFGVWGLFVMRDGGTITLRDTDVLPETKQDRLEDILKGGY